MNSSVKSTRPQLLNLILESNRLLPMKKNLAFGLALSALFTPALCAQPVVALWNFNDTNVATAWVGTGQFSAVGTAGVAFYTGSSADPAASNNWGLSLNSFPEQGTGARTSGVQFSADTAGYQNLGLTFDFRGSSTAPRNLIVQVSANGVDFQDAAAFEITRDGSWTNGLTVDLTGVAGVADNPAFTARMVAGFYDAAGYKAVKESSAYSPAGTWRLDMVTLRGTPTSGATQKPAILADPQDLVRSTGSTATFAVVASGTAPLAYQWSFKSAVLADALSSVLTLNNVDEAQAGTYQVVVSNPLGSATSVVATLTISNAPLSIVTNVAYLRAQVDPVTLAPTNTTQLYTVQGIVTTHTNLTTTNSGLFYMQDDTAGIAVFHSGAANVVPPAGARVRVTAPLSNYSGLLELAPVASNAQHEVATLSTGNPLPAPWLTSPAALAGLTAADIDLNFEGRLLTFTNVTVDLATPNFPTAGANVNIYDEAGFPFTLRVDARTDIRGQAKPTIPFAIIGVLSQYDPSSPYDLAYQILPSRFADIITPLKPPTVRFTNVLANLVRPGDQITNSFAEHALLPGETLTMTVLVTDPDGRDVHVEAVAEGLPQGAQWDLSQTTGKSVTGTLVYTATAAAAGQGFTVALRTWNVVATNIASWIVYVPTAAEQKVVLTEYLANPTSTATAAHYNPLRRDPASDNTSQHDEYLELANLSDTDVDLVGWSIADAVQIRHRFYESFVIGTLNAIVVYGGPLNGYLPNLDVPVLPASESSAGLALNNDGDTITFRNAAGFVVMRVVYSSSRVSSLSSMTRHPDSNGDFLPQAQVSAAYVVTPGRQYDGKLWSESPTYPPAEVRDLAARLNGDGSVVLTWQAQPGQTYSVWTAPAVPGAFTRAVTGLTAGEYADPNPGSAPTARFYRVSTP